MNALSLPIGSAVFIAVLGCVADPVPATGLYMDLPSYFSPVDTTRIDLAVRHTDLQLSTGRASVFSGELGVRQGSRLDIRLGLLYPAVERGRDITHAVGDGIINATFRIAGDTLTAGGLYFRGYGRLPIGPDGMNPFSGGSLDVGAGCEYRLPAEFFRLRCATTYTIVDERRKEPVYGHRNFFLFAASTEIDLRRGTTFAFEGFGFRFRGGDAREVYLITVRQRLSRDLELTLCGGLDAGDERERVFDSLLSVSIAFRLHPREGRDNPESAAARDLPPRPEYAGASRSGRACVW